MTVGNRSLLSIGKYRFHRFYCFWVVLKKNPTLGLFYPFVSKVLFTYMVLISRSVVCTSPFWNFNFFIWHEIEDIITLVMYLRCNLRIRWGFEKRSHDQVDNFIACHVLWKGLMELIDWKGLVFFHMKLDQ